MIGGRESAAAVARPLPSSTRSNFQEPTISTDQRAYESALNHDQTYDHDRIADDHLLLTTVGGAADLLADDLRGIGATSIAILGDDGVCCRSQGKINLLRTPNVAASIDIVLDKDSAAVPDLSAILASQENGVLSALDPDATLRFRVEVSGVEHRQAVIGAIQDRTGWINDPGDWQLNLTRRSGLWIAEVGYLHYSRRVGRLRRQPWSTNPVLAAVLVRIAKIKSGQTVHDPFCGTGTLLIASHQAETSVRLTGTDHDHQTLRSARANLHDHRVSAIMTETDAIPFPHSNGTIDRVISNLPFGKQVGSHTDNLDLYPDLIKELARTLRPTGRAILLTEDKRLLVDAVSRTTGIKIIRERLLRYNGASPTAYTITRTRTTQRLR